MHEYYRTIGRSWFSLSTEHARQHYTMLSNKYNVPAFTNWPMIVPLHDYTILDTYIFIFNIQSMIVTPSKNSNAIK